MPKPLEKTICRTNVSLKVLLYYIYATLTPGEGHELIDGYHQTKTDNLWIPTKQFYVGLTYQSAKQLHSLLAKALKIEQKLRTRRRSARN